MKQKKTKPSNKERSKILFDREELKHLTMMSRCGVFGGLGYSRGDLEKPLIGIANSWNEANVGHLHLRQLAQAVKEGILEAGGLPFEFNTIAPCDATSCGLEPMKYVLPQRDLIADSLELMIRSNSFDGAVFLSSCDKIVPGQLMAAARLRMPAVFVTGGPMLPRFFFAPKTFEWNRIETDYMRDPRRETEDVMMSYRHPGPGACSGFGTANTMQCLTEVLGLSLPGMATVHAVDAAKMRFARESGRLIVQLVERGSGTAAILTKEAFRNAIKALMAFGGSTNAVLHLLAVAHEAGIPLSLEDFTEAGKGIPTICGVIPSGSYSMLDLHRAGGVPAVMKRIEKFLNLDVTSVNGSSLGENLMSVEVFDTDVIRPLDNPFYPDSAIAVLYGNLAPQGAVVKQSAVRKDMLVHTGPARVFDSEAEARKGIEANRVRNGDVLVIRYEGPKGGPGMREMLGITRHLVYSGKADKVALVTDGRFSGFTNGPAIGHVCPEASDGGPIALLQDGDRITIDIPNRTVSVAVNDNELERRRSQWCPPEKKPDGYLARYCRMVRPASEGAWLGPV